MTQRRTTVWRVLLLTCVLALVVAACGDEGSTDTSAANGEGDTATIGSTLEEIETLAREESRLIFYTADGNDAVLAAVAKAFEAKYGVAVVYYKSTNAPLLERFLADSTRGEAPDVLLLSVAADYRGLIEDGMIAEYEISGIDELDPSIVADAPHAYPYTSYTFGLAYNTNLVGDLDPSEFGTWMDDVLIPEYADQMGMPDPNTVGGAFNATWTLRQALGDDGWASWQEAMGALNPRLFPSNLPLSDAIAAGEVSMGFIWDAIAATQIAAGAPMKLAYPSPTPSSYGLVGVVEEATNPNAARLFVDWFMSAEAQQLWTDIYNSTSTNVNVNPSPLFADLEWYERPESITFMGAHPNADERSAHLDEFNQLVAGQP